MAYGRNDHDTGDNDNFDGCGWGPSNEDREPIDNRNAYEQDADARGDSLERWQRDIVRNSPY